MSPTSAFLAVFVAASLGGCAADAPAREPARRRAAPRGDGGADVTLTARDGVKLAATVWPGAAANERCVVLVHQLASTREEWAALVERLRGRSEILALDLRGHGGSTRGPRGELAWRAFGPRDWARAVLDLDAATRWLGERGFRAADCVYVGSSIGASLVVRYVAEQPDAAGVVLLSPGLAYRDLRIVGAAAAYPGRALIVHSEEEGAAATVAELDRLWGERAELLPVGGTAHGVAMLDEHPAALDAIVRFVEAPR